MIFDISVVTVIYVTDYYNISGPSIDGKYFYLVLHVLKG